MCTSACCHSPAPRAPAPSTSQHACMHVHARAPIHPRTHWQCTCIRVSRCALRTHMHTHRHTHIHAAAQHAHEAQRARCDDNGGGDGDGEVDDDSILYDTSSHRTVQPVNHDGATNHDGAISYLTIARHPTSRHRFDLSSISARSQLDLKTSPRSQPAPGSAVGAAAQEASHHCHRRP